MRNVVLSDEALRHSLGLAKTDRAFLKEGIRKHLAETDPLQTSRNKFRLRRVSPCVEYELRLDRWRVFYRICEDRIEVTMIGEKRGNILFIGREEFTL